MDINFNGFYITSLIFGILAVLVCLLIYLFPSRTKTLIFKFLFDLFSTVNLIFVFLATGETLVFAGLATNIIGMARDIIFIFRGKYRWSSSYLVLLVFIGLLIGSAHYSYQNPLSLLPIFGSLINTSALYMKNTKNIKLTTIFGQILFITYYAILIKGSELLTILNLLCSVVTLISVIIGLIVLYKEYQKSVLKGKTLRLE